MYGQRQECPRCGQHVTTTKTGKLWQHWAPDSSREAGDDPCPATPPQESR